MEKLNQLGDQLQLKEARAVELAEKISAKTITDAERAEIRTLNDDIKKIEKQIEDARAEAEIVQRAAEAKGARIERNGPKGTPRSDTDKLFDAYSVTRAAQFTAGNVKSQDAVAELEVHAMAEEIARNCNLPTSGKGILIMSRSDVATALDAGNLGQTSFLPTIQGYQKQIFADKLGAKMYLGLTGIQKLPVSDTTAVAGFVAEGGSFGAVAANVRQKSLEPHAILAKSTNGWYLKAHAGADSDRILLDNLLKAEVNAVNANLIKSIGAAAPTGAFDDTDITDVTSANGQAITRALLITMKNSAASNDAGGQNPAWIISPTIQGKLENLATDTGSGLFVMDVNNPGKLMGYMAHVTTHMPINLAKGSGTNLQGVMFGYFDNLAVAGWAVRELIVDKASSDAGVVTKLVSFYDFAYANPKAFAKGYFTA